MNRTVGAAFLSAVVVVIVLWLLVPDMPQGDVITAALLGAVIGILLMGGKDE